MVGDWALVRVLYPALVSVYHSAVLGALGNQ